MNNTEVTHAIKKVSAEECICSNTYPKLKILSSFTQPRVISNSYDMQSTWDHPYVCSNVWNTRNLRYSSKYLLLPSAEEKGHQHKK